LRARIADWLGTASDRSIIVVTHGIVSRLLRGLYAGLCRTAALRLPVPQDRVFRLVDGAIDEMAIGPPETT
jgi:broad specificity phosphatase PhoE